MPRMKQPRPHPFLDHPRPIAIAHRGGALEVEENTLPAFEHAVGLGFTHVELDVHASRDGAVVIHHDETLERLTGDPRRLDNLELPELRGLRTRRGAGLPLLEELLAAFPHLFVNIEVKSDAVVEPLAGVIRRADALARVCVGSFSPRRTERLRTLLGPGLCWSPAHLGVARLWLLGWGLPFGAGPAPVVQVPPAYRGIAVVTPRFVRAAHARGVQVQVWTVDDADQIDALLDMGVDGIMSDRPRLLRARMQARGCWHGNGRTGE